MSRYQEFRCKQCDWEGVTEDLEPIGELTEDTYGDTMENSWEHDVDNGTPVAECPECGTPSPKSKVAILYRTVMEKDWVANDDHVFFPDPEIRKTDTFVWWASETYIANTQLDEVFEDPDVTFGVIENDDQYGFRIAIYPSEEW